MINWDKINKKISVKKIILPVFAVMLIILICVYAIIINKYIQKNQFTKQMEQVSEKNENPVFSIEKIYLCSSANAIDNTEEQKLNTLDLYQYTDIAIYLNNYSENNGLTSKNTIKELYIDNIELQLDSNIGKTDLEYTNLLKIGSREQLTNMLATTAEEQEINNNEKRIDFNIVNTNEQNEQADYENPTFYADCSNPISLKYINQIDKNYSIGNDNSATFDGSILEKAGISVEDINCKIKFKINLINNDEEYYSAWINFQIPLNDIYKGTTIKSKTTQGLEYNFFTL